MRKYHTTTKADGVVSEEVKKYLTGLSEDIFSCRFVQSHYSIEAECHLFNEISKEHCDEKFGNEMFKLKDLSDVKQFVHFVDVCYKKLLMGSSGPSKKCGCIRYNKESVVPYTVSGETNKHKLKADYISEWDLPYLKFCCKLQGIQIELFASDSIKVISLTDINGSSVMHWYTNRVASQCTSVEATAANTY